MSDGGPGSGLYRSNDGGTSWKRIEEHGLPKGPYGKIDVKDVDYPGYELHGAKGVPAKLQEGVMNAYLIDAQDLGPKACQLYLVGVSWSDKRDMQSAARAAR